MPDNAGVNRQLNRQQFPMATHKGWRKPLEEESSPGDGATLIGSSTFIHAEKRNALLRSRRLVACRNRVQSEVM